MFCYLRSVYWWLSHLNIWCFYLFLKKDTRIKLNAYLEETYLGGYPYLTSPKSWYKIIVIRVQQYARKDKTIVKTFTLWFCIIPDITIMNMHLRTHLYQFLFSLFPELKSVVTAESVVCHLGTRASFIIAFFSKLVCFCESCVPISDCCRLLSFVFYRWLRITVRESWAHLGFDYFWQILESVHKMPHNHMFAMEAGECCTFLPSV